MVRLGAGYGRWRRSCAVMANARNPEGHAQARPRARQRGRSADEAPRGPPRRATRGRRDARAAGLCAGRARVAAALPELDQRQRDVLGAGADRAGRVPRLRRSTAAGTAGGVGHGLAVALGWSIGQARASPRSRWCSAAACCCAPGAAGAAAAAHGRICLFAADRRWRWRRARSASARVRATRQGSGTRSGLGASCGRAAASSGKLLYRLAHRLVQQVGRRHPRRLSVRRRRRCC